MCVIDMLIYVGLFTLYMEVVPFYIYVVHGYVLLFTLYMEVVQFYIYVVHGYVLLLTLYMEVMLEHLS